MAHPTFAALALGSLAACGAALGLPACARHAHADAPDDREALQYQAYRQPQKMVAGLTLTPGQRVADVGAGRGLVTTRIADAVGPRGHVVALDIDGTALAAIPRRATIETRVVAADEPALEPAAYDRILLAEVDHLLPDRAVYLGKLMRALRPGGFIAVTNRVLYRAPLVSAAAAAGLRASEVPLDLPAHFFVRLEPR